LLLVQFLADSAAVSGADVGSAATQSVRFQFFSIRDKSALISRLESEIKRRQG
jgi:hypothetical protein